MCHRSSVYVLFCVCFIFLLTKNICLTQAPCKSDEFSCNAYYEDCIPQSSVCDGKDDCGNRKDESFEVCESQVCNKTHFHCASGACIPLSLKCNTVPDCSDMSDEADCNIKMMKPCPDEWMVSCVSGECIQKYQLCDGIKDCEDSSDETSSACSSITCPAYTFACDYGACVDSDSICNGVPDCADYSDELLPQCKTKVDVTPELICGKNSFKCNSGLCIKDEKLCDGVRDCDDGSDETYRQCKNRTCVEGMHWKCPYGACSLDVKCVSFTNYPSASDSAYYPPQLIIHNEPIPGDTEEVNRDKYFTTTPRPSYPTSNRPPACYIPSAPINGEVKTNMGVTPEPYTTAAEWTILIYKCNEGYSLGNSPSVIVCMNSQWTNPFPECLITCPPLLSPNHEIECVHDGKTIPCENSCEGTVANIKCKETFEIKDFVFQPYNGIQCNYKGNWSNTLFECNPECGTLIAKAQALVIKGYTAAKGEFPWHAGIYRREMDTDEYYEQICGGTLISDKVIISAAHCFWDWNQNEPNNDTNKYAIAVGKFYRTWNSTKDRHAQYSEIERIILPSRFRAEESSFANDIAILILNNSIKFTSRVRPVCVDWSNELHKSILKPGSLGTVAGWGLTQEFGTASEELQAVQMPFIEYETCVSNLPEVFRPFITHDKICAGYNNGTSICTGDSGGGIAFKKSNRYFIEGVVSVAPAKGSTCDSFQYVAFTSVPDHLNFIREIERETH